MLKCVTFTGRPNVGFMSINIKKKKLFTVRDAWLQAFWCHVNIDLRDNSDWAIALCA